MRDVDFNLIGKQMLAFKQLQDAADRINAFATLFYEIDEEIDEEDVAQILSHT